MTTQHFIWYNSYMKNKKLIVLFVMVVAALSFFVYPNLPAGRQEVFAVTAPGLKEGTYLTGQTLSVWPSWSTLGNALGQALPTDPINQLGTAGTCAVTTNRFCTANSQCPPAVGTTTPENCVLHDLETGWSTADRRFSFACSTSSYAYRYIVATSGQSYTVRARFEDPGIIINNRSSFIAGFISSTLFKIDEPSGVCNQDQEISTLQSGVCGDGQLNLNKGEQCDPPGRIEYAVGCTTSTPSIKNLKVCTSGCQWTNSTTLCSNFSNCGNGVKESGEACDDGGFNGRYNKCNSNCTGGVIDPPGRCGDGTIQPAYEICDTNTGPGYVVGAAKYSLTSRNSSCSCDCQNWGPYCGDKIVQAQYGEDCDGSQACTVGGGPGVQICTSGCKKATGNTSAWWRLDSISSAGKSPDFSGNLNHASCALATCPSTDEGRYGDSVTIEGKQFLTVNHSPSLVATTSLTVSAWIYPTDDATPYQKIVEKGGMENGYDLEFNLSSATHTARFNLWGETQTTVDTLTTLPIQAWSHLAATYKKVGLQNIVKIYLNGNLESENIVIRAAPVMDENTGSLLIGKSADESGNYFFGRIDDVKIYNRALSGDEIKSDFQDSWFCSATTTPFVPGVAGSCGNSVIDTGEDCDQGAANNGLPCAPTYGVSCSYCSADCKNSIDVQPTQYCGNGIIESSERCEISSYTNIYSASTNTLSTEFTYTSTTNGYREKLCSEEILGAGKAGKGIKTCADCALTRNCITCGLDPTGVEVNGKVLNVLRTRFSVWSDPLMVEGAWIRSLKLYFNTPTLDNCKGGVPTFYDPLETDEVRYNKVQCYFGNLPTSGYVPFLAAVYKKPSTPDTNLDTYTLQTTVAPLVNAKINSSLLCSSGEEPTYTMVVNNDYTHRFPFPVLSDPSPGQYDIIVSPIITSTRSKDVRVVVSWESTDEFYGGFARPSALEGADYGSSLATGLDYYITPPDNPPLYKQAGIWYHGFISSGKRVESFTVDTNIGSMNPGAYAFYVRTPDGGIEALKNIAKLKVEVFLPETGPTGDRLFGVPAKTYYLKDAIPSDNRTAGYWQVFNLSQPSASVTASTSHIMDVNRIFTGVASMAISTCTGLPAGTQCRLASITNLCDIVETCTGVSDFCPADVYRSAGTLCRAGVPGSLGCDLTDYCSGTSASCPETYAPVGTTCPSDPTFLYTCNATGQCNVCAAGWEMCSGGVCRNQTGLPCNDGNFCTINDTYQNDCGTVCVGITNTCNDSRSWTTDSCNEISDTCINTLNSCNDSNLCTVGDMYNISGTCVPGPWTPANCCRNTADCTAEESNPCLSDATCLSTNRCRYDFDPDIPGC